MRDEGTANNAPAGAFAGRRFLYRHSMAMGE